MVSDADLQGLDAKIVALTAKVQSLQQSCRHMEAGRTGQPPGGAPSVRVQRSPTTGVKHLFFVFLGLHLWHMEVPRLRVALEIQLLACTTATPDLSCTCDLRCRLDP